MDRNPASGAILAVKTESIPPQANASWDISWTPIEPSLIALCWTTGTECVSEAYNGASWVTKVSLPSIPVTARNLLVYYHCYNTKLNFRIWGKTQSHPLCFNSTGHDVGQAWIPLVQDIDANLKYDIKYESITPGSGMAMVRIIGWRE